MRELSNIDIDEIFHNVTQYAGCFMKDALPSKPKFGKFYIINLDNSDGEGTHWVLCSFLNKDYNFYFDPFGLAPPISILKFLKSNSKPILTFDIDLQNIKSSSCGWFCCYVARQLIEGRKLIDILYDDFSMDTVQNEKRLRHYFYKN
jgi:hypothetical protein